MEGIASKTDDVRRTSTTGASYRRRVIGLSSIASFLFVATYALKALTDGLYVAHDVESALVDVKYLTALLAVLCSLPSVLRSKREVFGEPFKKLLVVLFAFIIFPCLVMLIRGAVNTTCLGLLLKMAIPIFLAYCMLNCLSEDQIYRDMVAILVFSIIGYGLEIGFESLSFDALFSASIEDSESVTESSHAASNAIMLCFYFCYFRKNKVWVVLSILFAIFVFKRLMIVYAIAAFILPLVFDPDRRIKKGWAVFFKLAFFLAAFAWLWLLLPENGILFYGLFGETQSDFTSGRNQMLVNALSHNYVMYGFGSIQAFAGRGIEMDFARLILEVSPLGLALFIWLYWDMACNRLYGTFVMTFVMAQMLFADSLGTNFAWTLLMILMGFMAKRPASGRLFRIHLAGDNACSAEKGGGPR